MFDICGSGSKLEELKATVVERQLSHLVTCHGYCSKLEMREMLERSHAIIVPTTSDFVEGINKVVVEAVLSSRPAVTSSVCSAVDHVGDAVVEVPTDNIEAYADALVKLCEGRDFYDEKCQACCVSQEQFYDPTAGWAAALESILKDVKDAQRK